MSIPLRVWAPRAHHVEVAYAVGRRRLMRPDPDRDGWFVGPDLHHGQEYRLVLDGGAPLPDPLGRWLPDGVHGMSRAFDATGLAWSDKAWRGRTLREGALLYELHVGTFTATGTLDAAIERLDRLVDLGVTHVELMPLAAFDGPRGWGYDGVALNAVHEPYGGPFALARFVDAAHGRELAVLLDVVHNHVGPSGSNWEQFGPFLSATRTTPWGKAVNLDEPGSDDVRSILRDSALGWLRDFHLDGLRLDAVHALSDGRARTFLAELSDAVAALSVDLGRPLAFVAESDRNDPRTVAPTGEHGFGMSAQWDDDVHHALHWLLTHDTSGIFADFASCAAVAYTLEHGFWHDGRWSSFRGQSWGAAIDWAFTRRCQLVTSLQTHDQVGNRGHGERLSVLAGRDLAACGAALLLTLPYSPMLFMGEEWGATTPWLFFSSFDEPGLAHAVASGRRAELAAQGWGAGAGDPQDPESRVRSVLDWGEADSGAGAEMLAWYRTLIGLRAGRAREFDDDVFCTWREAPDGSARWFSVQCRGLRAVANVCDEPVSVELDGTGAVLVAAWRDGAWLSEPPNDGSPTDEASTMLVLKPRTAAVLTVQTPRPSTVNGELPVL